MLQGRSYSHVRQLAFLTERETSPSTQTALEPLNKVQHPQAGFADLPPASTR